MKLRQRFRRRLQEPYRGIRQREPRFGVGNSDRACYFPAHVRRGWHGPTPSKAQVFLRRLITTVILWTVILAALFSENRLISNSVFFSS